MNVEIRKIGYCPNSWIIGAGLAHNRNIEPLGNLVARTFRVLHMSNCCLIVPCYNESDRLPVDAFVGFLRENPGYSCLFVDDGSTDNTSQLLTGVVALLPEQMEVLEQPENGGKAEAVRSGMLHAALNPSNEFVGFIDADLSAPLKVMKELYEELNKREHYHSAFGSRVKRMGAHVERLFVRHFLGRIFATMATNVLGVVAYDSQCGAKLFRRGVVAQLFAEPFVSAWFFDLELILRAEKKGIVEVPVSEWKEVGQSKIKFVDFIKAPFEILKIRKHYL